MCRSPFERGQNTALPGIIAYRVGRLRAEGILKGRWLDLGCAEGGYLEALLQAGVTAVVGADVEAVGVERAALRLADNDRVHVVCVSEDELPFQNGEFDGCLLNEVLEHVLSDVATLEEVFRVLAPGGHIAVMSPNRYFPLEGHGAHLGKLQAEFPFPIVHWLPRRLGRRFMSARTYSPSGLAMLIEPGWLRVGHGRPHSPSVRAMACATEQSTASLPTRYPIPRECAYCGNLPVSLYIDYRTQTCAMNFFSVEGVSSNTLRADRPGFSGGSFV